MVEKQAQRFAGAFLLPESTFSELFSPSLDQLLALKAKVKVSIGLMIKRASELGLVRHERRLWINLARRGWRLKEPLDDVLEPEAPQFIKRSIELLIERNIVPRDEMPFHLALPTNDIEKLTGLSSGYFDECQQVLPLKMRQETDSPHAERSGEETIIQFRKASKAR